MRDTIRTKKIFLLDALGALITSFILGFVGFLSPSWFGFPQEIVLFLAGFAVVLALISSAFYLKKAGSNSLFLRVLILGNSLYCVLTLAAIAYYFDSLTILALIYFSVEIFIISVLILLEYRILN